MVRPTARFDDLIANRAFVLDDLVEVRAAATLDEVIPIIAAAQVHARNGCWVAVMLAYEAGAAFDTAFPRRDLAGGAHGVPLAWFGAFASRREVQPVHPVQGSVGTDAPTDVVRRGGSDWYTTGVDACRAMIAEGNVYQVNLTDRCTGSYTGTPHDLYRAMAVAQGGAFNACIDIGGTVIVSASPELFLRIEDGVVTARPMKGTTPRRPRCVDDERAADELVESAKERAENVMIVDLLRNDLSRLARGGGVTVPVLFATERYETVWQMTSTVRAELAEPDLGLVEILRATFPCGSVTGAPKVAAMRIIDELEPWPRGAYCGAIGIIEPKPPGAVKHRVQATFSVAIRTAVLDIASGNLEFGTGAGITWGSDPNSEDAEVDAKSAVLTTRRPAFDLLETLRVHDGHAPHLPAHLRRLQSSANWFGFAVDIDAVRAECEATIASQARSGCWRMRVLVDREGRANVELSAMDATDAMDTTDAMDATSEGIPVRLAVEPYSMRSDDVFCCHKTTNRILYEQVAGRHPDADDVLLTNERGEVTETCRANLLYRIGSRWFTPPLSSGGLAGIGRQIAIEHHGVRERVLRLDELDDVTEFVVVSSLRGRRPARIWR